MGAEIIAWSFTSGWASGINAYAVVLVMGLFGRFADVEIIPQVLTRPDVLIAAAILFGVELVADKIPGLDSIWDTAHTVIRPAAGATIAFLMANQSADLDAAFAAATGGITALASHAVKAGIRLGVNTSPEPASNVLLSTAEDAAVAGVVSLAVAEPWLAAGIAALLLIAGALLVLFLLSRIRRLKARYDEWGTRRLGRLNKPL